MEDAVRKIRIIKKNDAGSLEYEVGDILTVEGIWYGGINAKGKSGIPLSLDREEYEEYAEEAAAAVTVGKNAQQGQVDPWSYQLGVTDCFREMISSGLKTIAMSHPFSDEAEKTRFLEEVKALCARYGIPF